MPYVLLAFLALVVVACSQRPLPEPPQNALPVICADRDSIVTRLSEGYLEELRGIGVANSGTVMELWHTPGGETFTIFFDLPNGVSCMVAAGENWQQVAPKPRGNEL